MSIHIKQLLSKVDTSNAQIKALEKQYADAETR